MANLTETDGNQARASARYLRVAPNKVRQTAQHLRGLRVEEARDQLRLSPKGPARDLLKVLESAAANAENNNGLDPDELVVVGVVVDEGPILRRWRPRAMGRATRIRKRTTHVTVIVGEAPRERRPPPPPERRKRGRRGKAESEAPEAESAAPETEDQEE
jgi:large subunit ribosomal protein L22